MSDHQQAIRVRPERDIASRRQDGWRRVETGAREARGYARPLPPYEGELIDLLAPPEVVYRVVEDDGERLTA